MPNRRDLSEKLKTFARDMRADPSESERVLWHHLRMKPLNGHKFRRQVPILGRIADFACLERMLIVEADGARHFEPGAQELDAHRDADLAWVGWRTLRFTSVQISRQLRGVLETILEALDESPTPRPPPASGRRSPT